MKRLLFMVLGLYARTSLEASDPIKLELKYDFFLERAEFEKVTGELKDLYPGVLGSLFSSMIYPKPVVGYLYYFAKKVFEPSKMNDTEWDNFFTAYAISHTKGEPSEKSESKRAVEQFVTKAILEWLYYVPAKSGEERKPFTNGKENVNSYLQLVARYILTRDMKEKDVVFATKWVDKKYTVAEPIKDELLDCISEALDAHRPSTNDLAKGTLFEVFKIDLSKVVLLSKLKTLLVGGVVDKKIISSVKGKKKPKAGKTLVKELVLKLGEDDEKSLGLNIPDKPEVVTTKPGTGTADVKSTQPQVISSEKPSLPLGSGSVKDKARLLGMKGLGSPVSKELDVNLLRSLKEKKKKEEEASEELVSKSSLVPVETPKQEPSISPIPPVSTVVPEPVKKTEEKLVPQTPVVETKIAVTEAPTQKVSPTSTPSVIPPTTPPVKKSEETPVQPLITPQVPSLESTSKEPPVTKKVEEGSSELVSALQKLSEALFVLQGEERVKEAIK